MLRCEREPSLRERFETLAAQAVEIVLPAVSLFEMRYGHAKSRRKGEADLRLEAFLARGVAVIPFEAEDAGHAGEIRAVPEAKDASIGAYNILMGAQARRRGATLVTANTREFERVPGLLVINWARP